MENILSTTNPVEPWKNLSTRYYIIAEKVRLEGNRHQVSERLKEMSLLTNNLKKSRISQYNSFFTPGDRWSPQVEQNHVSLVAIIKDFIYLKM